MTAQVTLVGNLTRDPELRFTAGGMAVATFGMAVNRKYKETEEVSFFDVTAFGSLAENLVESVTKAMRVVVVGRLTQRSWEDNQEKKHYKIEVVADEVSPSLRWSTAEVTKTERDGAPQGKDHGGKDTRGGGFQRPSRSNSGPRYDYDEDPFVMDSFEGEDRFAPGTRKYVP